MTSFKDRSLGGVDRCQPADLAALAVFQARMFGTASPQQDPYRVEWLYARNPQHRVEGLGTWIARRDGEIVGQQAEIAVDLHVGDDTCPATWAIDLMVDPVWRLRGVAPALAAAQRVGSRVVCGLNVGDMAARSFLRDGWIDLGRVPAYVLPLDVPRVLDAFDVQRWHSNLALSAAARTARVSARLMRGRINLVPVDEFDERSEHVWTDAKSSYPVIARRDHASLRWRFDEAPARSDYSRFLGFVAGSSEPVGYVVLRRGTWNEAPVLNVVDYLARPDRVGSLLLAASSVAEKQGVAALRCVTLNPSVDRALQLRGFLRRRMDQAGIRFMIRMQPEEPLAATLGNPRSWFITSADSDLDFSGPLRPS